MTYVYNCFTCLWFVSLPKPPNKFTKPKKNSPETSQKPPPKPSQNLDKTSPKLPQNLRQSKVVLSFSKSGTPYSANNLALF